ncbi:MAG: hypothetical protein GXP08_16670 [Gammaproteobacteria bacterium]|nr:hypothetical protein [Gammaproteobacteria bacterium]
MHEEENAEHANCLIGKACLGERIHQEGLVLHSDNGSPMKGAVEVDRQCIESINSG